MAYCDKTKVNKYVPKNRGMIHAVQWTGKVECLVGLPNLNEVMVAVHYIDKSGHLSLTCTGDDEQTNVRPFKDFVVIDQFGKLTVYSPEAMKENYDVVEVPEIPSGPIKREFTIIEADRPDDT